MFCKVSIIESDIKFFDFNIAFLFETLSKGSSIFIHLFLYFVTINYICRRIFTKEYLPMSKANDFTALRERLNVFDEITFNDKKCFLACVYRSLCQNLEEFVILCCNFNSLLSDINSNMRECSVTAGDFNYKYAKRVQGG